MVARGAEIERAAAELDTRAARPGAGDAATARVPAARARARSGGAHARGRAGATGRRSRRNASSDWSRCAQAGGAAAGAAGGAAHAPSRRRSRWRRRDSSTTSCRRWLASAARRPPKSGPSTPSSRRRCSTCSERIDELDAAVDLSDVPAADGRAAQATPARRVTPRRARGCATSFARTRRQYRELDATRRRDEARLAELAQALEEREASPAPAGAGRERCSPRPRRRSASSARCRTSWPSASKLLGGEPVRARSAQAARRSRASSIASVGYDEARHRQLRARAARAGGRGPRARAAGAGAAERRAPRCADRRARRRACSALDEECAADEQRCAAAARSRRRHCRPSASGSPSSDGAGGGGAARARRRARSVPLCPDQARQLRVPGTQAAREPGATGRAAARAEHLRRPGTTRSVGAGCRR